MFEYVRGIEMNNDKIKAIVDILNQDDTNSRKRDLLREAKQSMSEVDQLTTVLVIELLTEHVLPFEPGRSIHIYELGAATESTYQNLKQILQDSECSYFNATCGELLWDHYHDAQYAEISVLGYWAEFCAPSWDGKYALFHVILGICRICSKYRVPGFDFETFVDACECHIRSHFEDLKHFGVSILKALAMCDVPFERIEKLALDVGGDYEVSQDYDMAIAYEEFLEKQYVHHKKTDQTRATRVKIARLYEASADRLDWENAQDSHRIVLLVHKAMNAWEKVKTLDAKSERERLARRLAPVKELTLQTMQTIKSGPLDISEMVEYLSGLIEKSSLEENVYNLAFITDTETQQGLLKWNRENGTVLTELFQTTILDGTGRHKCVVPALHGASPEDVVYALEHEAAKKYSILAQTTIIRYLYLLRQKETITEESLRFVVNENVFIPPDRKESFLKGLVAGFNLDLVTAIPVLMPQVENAIRVLAERCGAVVYKTKSDGTEECLSLESILRLPEVTDCLDEDLIFNMRVFYTSAYGIGMRNDSGHGLLSDRGLQSDNSLAVWWFTLRLCCMFSRELHVLNHFS